MRRTVAVAAAAALALAPQTACLTARFEGLGVSDAPAREALQAATLAFAEGDDLRLARGDGSDSRRILAGRELGPGGALFMPAVSPDRRRLLFMSVVDLDVRESTGRDLSVNLVDLSDTGPGAVVSAWRRIRLDRIAPPDESGRQQVFSVAGAGWSSDGTRIAVGLNRPAGAGGDAILLLDAQGAPRALYALGGRDLSRVGSISWAPDGRSILAGGETPAEGGGTLGIVLKLDLGEGTAASGPAVTELGPGRQPALSPDGSRIAVVDDRSGQWDLLLLDPNGREIDRFVRPAGRGLHRPQWSPDGRYLYYYSLASTGPLGLVEITILRCLDTRSRRVFDLVRLG